MTKRQKVLIILFAVCLVLLILTVVIGRELPDQSGGKIVCGILMMVFFFTLIGCLFFLLIIPDTKKEIKPTETSA